MASVKSSGLSFEDSFKIYFPVTLWLKSVIRSHQAGHCLYSALQWNWSLAPNRQSNVVCCSSSEHPDVEEDSNAIILFTPHNLSALSDLAEQVVDNDALFIFLLQVQTADSLESSITVSQAPASLAALLHILSVSTAALIIQQLKICLNWWGAARTKRRRSICSDTAPNCWVEMQLWLHVSTRGDHVIKCCT